MKYIRKSTHSSYFIQKSVKGKQKCFGGYSTLETARLVRDRLMEVDWDREEYQKIRDEFRAEGVEL